jgi:hypothetical protein
VVGVVAVLLMRVLRASTCAGAGGRTCDMKDGGPRTEEQSVYQKQQEEWGGAVAPSNLPWVEKLHLNISKVAHIARNDGEVVVKRCRSQ